MTWQPGGVVRMIAAMWAIIPVRGRVVKRAVAQAARERESQATNDVNAHVQSPSPPYSGEKAGMRGFAQAASDSRTASTCVSPEYRGEGYVVRDNRTALHLTVCGRTTPGDSG